MFRTVHFIIAKQTHFAKKKLGVVKSEQNRDVNNNPQISAKMTVAELASSEFGVSRETESSSS